MEPLAPDILDRNAAQQLGACLSQICKKNEAFLKFFESPGFDPVNITAAGFRRSIEPAFAGKRASEILSLFVTAGLLRRFAGSQFLTLESFTPTCRINSANVVHGNRSENVFICTDSPIVEFDTRVFPWVDEGITLFSRIGETWASKTPERILDVCCGAGTAGILLGKLWPKASIVGVDNNKRAILYAEFNADLNCISRYRTEMFDLTSDKALSYVLGEDGFDVVCIDPPFTSMPRIISGYAHSSDTAVLEASLRQAIPQVRTGGLLVLLCYAFGSSEQPDELYDLLSQIDLPGFDPPSVQLVRGPVWRLRGVKCNPRNPMPAQYIATRYIGPGWTPKFEKIGFGFDRYVDWIEDSFVANGLTHLHYVTTSLRRQ